MEGHAQAPAFAALGRHFEEVEHKPEQAMRCYKRALALDPSVAVAGQQAGGGGGTAPSASWVNNVVGADDVESSASAAGSASDEEQNDGGKPAAAAEDSAQSPAACRAVWHVSA